jgi:hypothetical protein
VSGSAQSADPPPYWADPLDASSSTRYDASLNVIDFTLGYFTVAGLPPNPPKRGPTLPTTWLITASANYASSYSAPSASTWIPIGYSTDPAEYLHQFSLFAGSPLMGLRALWENTYGPLPPKGNIRFKITPIDADTGAGGPPLTTTCSWENGTLRGSDLALSPVPLWGFSTEAVIPPLSVPGSVTCAIAITGQPGYAGTIALKIAAGKYYANYGGNPSYPLPAGVTFVFDPPTVTLDPSSEGPVSVTLTITAAAGSAAFDALVKISGTDGVSTQSYKTLLTLSGDVVALPPLQQITMQFANVNPNLAQGASVVCPCTVYNVGPETLSIAMLATTANPGLTFSWDTPAFTLAPGTPSSPTGKTINLTVTAAAASPTPTTTVFAQAQAGSQVGNAGLIIAWA